MKKTIIIAFAAFLTFAACDKNEFTDDYATWTTEELLASPGGLDYLVKTASPIDYAYIDEQLKTKVFGEKTFYVLDKDGWTDSSEWYGRICLNYYCCLDDATIRVCTIGFFDYYVTPTGDITNRFYTDRPFTGDRLTAMLDAFQYGSKPVAQIGDTLIVDWTDGYRRLWRYVVTLKDSRDQLLEEFPYSMDELTPDYLVIPQN